MMEQEKKYDPINPFELGQHIGRLTEAVKEVSKKQDTALEKADSCEREVAKLNAGAETYRQLLADLPCRKNGCSTEGATRSKKQKAVDTSKMAGIGAGVAGFVWLIVEQVQKMLSGGR